MPTPTKQAAARAEARAQTVTVETKGETFELPPKLPFAFAAYAMEGELLKALRALLPDEEQEARLMGLGLDMDEFGEFLEQVQAAYGLDPGGASASPVS